MKNKFKNISKNRGMTLVELIMVSIIFIIVSSISIFNYNKFNSSISLQNLTDEIALSIRKVQGYAIGAKGIGSQFSNKYGLSFSVSDSSFETSPIPSKNSFVIFVDTQDNYSYNYETNPTKYCGTPTATNECLEFLSIKNRDKISKIEVYKNGSPIVLDVNSSINILFERPNPEAVFCYKTSASSLCDSDISRVIISIESDNSGGNAKTRSVTVWSTGQIHIN